MLLFFFVFELDNLCYITVQSFAYFIQMFEVDTRCQIMIQFVYRIRSDPGFPCKVCLSPTSVTQDAR